ncbi:U520 [Culex quinquefasciatus]|uniref:U520 n=1 Tax=Culex quinquefasciatus TaxID=7176 RepID=B0WP68_CULQU|nr:U520 [Culex quinquefasciatus]|eukprot:XP_001850502.1 U520 [Culex quinquefasciatus]
MPASRQTLMQPVAVQFAMLEMLNNIQPITRSTLPVELTITPDFQCDGKVLAECQGTHYRDHGRQVVYFVAMLLRSRSGSSVGVDVGRPGRFNITHNASRIAAMSKTVNNAEFAKVGSPDGD